MHIIPMRRAACQAFRPSSSIPTTAKMPSRPILRHSLLPPRPRPTAAVRHTSSTTYSKPPIYHRPSFHLALFTVSLLSGAAYLAMSTRDFIAYTDEDTLTAFTPSHPHQLEVETTINTHPLAIALRADKSYTESRPTLKIKESYRNASLTSGVLSGPGKIVVPPYVWTHTEDHSLVSILYIGQELCGYPGLVHGGLLATLLDEGLARCSFGALPNKLGMTANLTINYKKPSPAEMFVVLRARCVKVEGRKCWVEGHIETLPRDREEPVVLVEASALMLEPKQAKMLKSVVSVPV